MKIRSSSQLDLLDWSPPVTVVSFDPQLIRANSFGGRLKRAISVCLKDTHYSRSEIAERMSDRLGRTITLNVLNAYASVARDTHEISVPRFNALVGAIGDRRLVEFVAADHGWAVIDRKHLPFIELAAVNEQKRVLAAQERQLRASARRGLRS